MQLCRQNLGQDRISWLSGQGQGHRSKNVRYPAHRRSAFDCTRGDQSFAIW